MAVSGKSRTFALSKNRKFQKLKDNKPSRRAARQHTWRAFFILGGSGIFVHYRLFLTCSAADTFRCAINNNPKRLARHESLSVSFKSK